MVDQVEGADAAALTQKVTKHFGSLAASIKGPTAPLANARIASNGAASTSGAANGVGSKQQSQQALQPRLDKLVHSAPVMLFMKGTPEGPRCGFSAKVVDALQKAGIEFKHFDILSDEAVRQGLKVRCCQALEQQAVTWGPCSAKKQDNKQLDALALALSSRLLAPLHETVHM